MLDETIKVLLIEDNPNDARLIQDYLGFDDRQGTFEVETAESLRAGLERLQGAGYDVVLLDLSLPDSHGLATFSAVGEAAGEMPVVVLTGLADEKTALEAVRHGAEDYLVKDQVDDHVLTRALRYALERGRAREALRSSEAKFRGLFESVLDGVFQIDSEGRLLTANPALVEMLGYSSHDELLRRHIVDLFVDAGAYKSLVRRLTERGEIRNAELTLAAKDGRRVTVLANLGSLPPDGKAAACYLGTFTDITERRRYQEQLSYLSTYDPLTRLLNRRRFQQEMELRLQEVRRRGSRAALLCLDIDQLKEINDTFGHQAGDELLVLLGGMLRHRLRQDDLLGRLGGDEFGVLLHLPGRRKAEVFAEKLLAEIGGARISVQGHILRATMSIGIAYANDSMSAEELLAQADLAMSRAKEEGRNRFTVHNPTLVQRSLFESRAAMAHRIREALEKDHFELFAQPIVALANDTDETERYELLLRLPGNGDKAVLPEIILHVAERFGLAREIDRWVARRAIGMLAREAQNGRRLRFEVNLSASSLNDDKLLWLIEKELDATAVDPACLVWEITETTAISDLHRAMGFIGRLKELGCQFALDDFGVGFSSFLHLKHLPVDYLKIDGGFVRDLARDAADQHLVQAMVQIARDLGKKTIAEWVEDEETLELLRRFGVDYAQGYATGRPLPFTAKPCDAAPDLTTHRGPWPTAGSDSEPAE